MPRMVVLQDQGISPLSEEAYLDESGLQRLLEEHPELIALDDVDPTASPLLPIGREVPLAGQSLDLLFLDLAGRPTGVETKLRRNPQVRREVVGQVLEYGAYLSTWTVKDIERQAERYLADPQTPARFQGQGLYEALSRLDASGPTEEGGDEAGMRSRISNSLERGHLRLLIAVDRVVDPLRKLVTFLNGASSFDMYLLEVQQYRAPDGMKIASINVYGGAGSKPNGAGVRRTAWDEARFLQALRSEASAASAAVALELYSFAQEQADSPVWGTGTTVGSVGFGTRRGGGRLVIFWLNTNGQVTFSTGALNRNVPREARASLLATLRSFGIDASDKLLEMDVWLTFDAGRLRGSELVERFKSAILQVRESLGRGA